jgi:hypothetical protein
LSRPASTKCVSLPSPFGNPRTSSLEESSIRYELHDSWKSAKLTRRFSPEIVFHLSEEQVERLGSEDDSTVTERADLSKKLAILEKGLNDLDAFTARSESRAQ